MSSVIVAKTSVILAFKSVISGTGVENTLYLTCPHKKKLRGLISGDRGGQVVGPFLPFLLFGNVVSKNQNVTNVTINTWRKIFETNLSNDKKIYVSIPRSFLVIKVCNQGKNLYSPCIFVFKKID